MANTNITVRMDEGLKKDLQNLMSNLGMDMTTFFTLAAKQAVREQALPFQPKMINGRYDSKAYQLAMENTTYDSKGRAVITKDDEWREETEWDDIYEQMKAERGI
jgi:DNA-damage-inducible protein J